MEILKPANYKLYEDFVISHPMGGLTQSTLWHDVKNNWGNAVVISRDKDENIVGGVSVLIQKVPLVGASLLYAPRGMVCDPHNVEVIADLKSGIDQLAKTYNGYLFKVDPDIAADDKSFGSIMSGLGFENIMGGDGFENIQPRFNWRLYLSGMSEGEVFAGLTQKTRYNVRVAQKHGVEIKICGLEALADFSRLMNITGQRDGFSVRPNSYFERLLTSLGDCARLYMALYNGLPVSGAITTNYAGKTAYLYGASDNEYRNVMPNYLLQWEMIKWAVETNCSVYDFQGVSGNLSEDHHLYGLYRFKRGFGGRLDELCGEYDFVYKPFSAKLIKQMIETKEWLGNIKKRLVGS